MKITIVAIRMHKATFKKKSKMEPVLRLDILKSIDTQKRILILISNAVIAFHLTDE